MCKLSQVELHALFDYNPNTGILTWRESHGGAKKGKAAGYFCKRHVQIRVDKKLHYAHRLAWVYVYGEEPLDIDHKNGDPTDNRIENLRSVTHQTNMENLRRATSKNLSGFLGVGTYKREGQKTRYIASIIVNGKRYKLCRFDTPEEAHEAYLNAKRELHKGCTI